MSTIVPPGGFAGFSQMTQASQTALRGGVGRRSSGPRRRKKTAKRSNGAKRRRRTTARKAGRLVKGSAAAKRFMANLRRKRKK